MSSNGPCDHQSIAHREAKPGAKAVGVAHPSYRPIPVLRFSCTLVILWILLLSLVTVGCAFWYVVVLLLGAMELGLKSKAENSPTR
jgi:hypothetical protein